MTKNSAFPWQTLAVIVSGCFAGGLVLALGLAWGNRLTGLPLFTQSVNLVSTNQVNLFTAQGEAKITVVPDEAVINLGITVTNSNVQTAQSEANRIMNQLQDDLLSLGVEKKDIKTQNYSLYPNYDWSGEVRRITGYSVDSSVRVTVADFELLNRIVDTAAADGINEIGNINFTLSEAKQAELQKQARQEAIEQAKANAEQLATLTGIHLGNIVNVEESQSRPRDLITTNMLRSYAVAEDLGSGATSIEAGETTYDYYVTLSYQTL